LELAREIKSRIKRRKLFEYFPDDGPLSRDKYPKHLSFFAAGTEHRERLMLAANRVGKTESVGGYELVCHLTGIYPDWWEGRTFDHPVKAWAAGDTSQTVREIIQEKLLGAVGDEGTGLIPGDCIVNTTAKGGGVPHAVDTIFVRHSSGGVSRVVLKSYDQKRKSFQGTEQDIIWLDEEPPLDIYTKCLIRTMTTNGLIMCTFTPLLGLSDVVLSFLPGGKLSTENTRKFVVMATWDDAPHLSDRDKEELWDSIPPFQRDARAKGIPQLGSGAIYPVPESEFVCMPFEIPDYWPRIYGLDVGWNRTAAVWGAVDPESWTIYLYSEHYQGHAEPSVHADAIRARGAWIPGEIDPGARGRGQKDGEHLYQAYRDLGLNIKEADNAIEAGLHKTFQRFASGRLRVFSTLQNWLSEFRIYRRDDKGRIVKDNDHLMDATRYLVMGVDHATTEVYADDEYRDEGDYNEISGY